MGRVVSGAALHRSYPTPRSTGVGGPSQGLHHLYRGLPARLVLVAALAYLGSLPLQVEHAVLEVGAPSFVLHWLRDATLLAIPTAVVVHLCCRRLERHVRRTGRRPDVVLVVLTLSSAAAVVAVPGAIVHSMIFEVSVPIDVRHTAGEAMSLIRTNVVLVVLATLLVNAATWSTRRLRRPSPPVL